MKQDLREIIEIINKVANTSSTNDKQVILRHNANNELLKKVLIYTYNTDYNYGIKKTTVNKFKYNRIGESKWLDLFEMLNELASSNINNDLTRQVELFLKDITKEDEKDLVIKILLKDLRIGMNVKSINKSIPNLIPQHQVMLASKFEGVLKGEVSVSLKLDGIRNSAMIDNGMVIHKSRQGKVVEGLQEITKALLDLGLDGYFVDGELIRKNIDNIPSDDNFRLTTTIVNSKSQNKQGLEFVVFDITPIEDYYRGKCDLTYIERVKLMESKIGEGNEFVRLVRNFGIMSNVDEIYGKLDEVIKQQYEGLMLNTLNGKYEFGKRPKCILKVKKFHEGDVLVTDILEGEGRLEGTLGKVEIQFMYDGKVYTNYLGSGFNDSERNYFWEHKDELLNKVITIGYFEISTNQQGEVGFRFPTWKGKEYIRHDKQGINDTNIE